MRKCFSEQVDVYEVDGDDLADLLSRTAVTVAALKDSASFFNVITSHGIETLYSVTLYVHA